ncbi:MAG: cyclic nucleotide-binding domain-containing protein, partial [Flavobacteriaceae bacterium]|nr:cyclic nucleotide-binding domain-containing protein [Flavobacteriaceae bacterium]
MKSQCEKCVIRDLNSLNSIPPEDLLGVSNNKTTIHIKRGEVIFSEGTSLKGVYCLRNGKCKLTKLAPNGKEQIVRFIKKGELVGHRSVISNSVAHLTVTALEEMDVCFIPKNEILELFKK